MNFNRSFSAAALALLIISGSAVAQVKKKTVAHKTTATQAAKPTADKPLPADPNVIIGKLPNGLTYYIRQNTEPKNKAVLYLVK